MKTVIRHIWEEYMEMAEDIGNKEIYEQRKETSERIFGTVKDFVIPSILENSG